MLSQEPAAAPLRRYLAILLGVPVAVAASLAGLNYVVDPYLIHQWDTPLVQRLRPPREKLGPWGKSYAIARYRPEVLYLGNSRTEMGLAVKAKEQRVFNGGVSGGSLGDAIRMLRHAAHAGPLRTVIWGLDAPSFSTEAGNSELHSVLMAEGPGYFLQRTAHDLQRAISFDMSRDTIALLAGHFGAECRSSLALRGQRDENCIRSRLNGLGGTKAAVMLRTREFLHGVNPGPAAMAELESQIQALCGVRFRLYVNPTHAMMLEALYQAGKGQAVEAWLRGLAAAGERLRRRGCDVRVFDFSGFNRITSEPVPQASGLRDMVYYWETSHYRDNVGELVLARLHGGAADADGFGEELTVAGMPSHLARLHAARKAYRGEHPVETALARQAASDYVRGR